MIQDIENIRSLSNSIGAAAFILRGLSEEDWKYLCADVGENLQGKTADALIDALGGLEYDTRKLASGLACVASRLARCAAGMQDEDPTDESETREK
ncbi:MAG TPA: hypothetical protein PKJ47_09955 [Candidatus Limiplasma sp.]|nr:hypothetical protein [Candidatus Limiplasma sp.]